MGRSVFVLGAGASFGDTLITFEEPNEKAKEEEEVPEPPNPPLICNFFDSEFLNSDPDTVEKINWNLVQYIKQRWGITDPFATGMWKNLSLEDVFTHVAIDNEFLPEGSSQKARAQLLLNELKNYIRRIIGHSTAFRFGKYTHFLSRNLQEDDSIISFNYDLLLDQEFITKDYSRYHYHNFHTKFLESPLLDADRSPIFEEPPEKTGYGLYLKLHGSLNWFLCTNVACPRAEKITVITWIQQCLLVSAIGEDFDCSYCRGKLSSLLIPPLLNKPVIQSRIFRNIWGNALHELEFTSNIIIVGYSFPTTDFYVEWLFRSALKRNKDVKVWIVNPLNDPANPTNRQFSERMRSIFPRGYEDRLLRFDQIEEVLGRLEEQNNS